MWANIAQSQIQEPEEQKLVIIIDKDMKFDEYILTHCIKVERKLCAFVESQFGYCRLYGCYVQETQKLALIRCMSKL